MYFFLITTKDIFQWGHKLNRKLQGVENIVLCLLMYKPQLGYYVQSKQDYLWSLLDTSLFKKAIFSNHFVRSNKINALNRPMTKTKFPVNEQNLFNLNCNLFDKSNNIKKSSIKKRQQENKASICIFLRSLYWPIALLHREKVWYNTCKTLSCLHYSLKGFV